VPSEVLRARTDELARLGTAIVTLTGGEPFLHPGLFDLIAHIRKRAMFPMMSTNGFLMNAAKIRALNQAGLYGLQISVDNLVPGQASRKSLQVLLPKLEVLATHARFRVRLNSVLGAGPPQDALAVARAATRLGFDSACAILHDDDGQLVALDHEARQVYQQLRKMAPRSPFHLDDDFQLALLERGHLSWKCRAGARYLYVCEDGLVHLCSQRRGEPGVALADYTEQHIAREYHAVKHCARRCTLPCVHHASSLDELRSQGNQSFGASLLARRRR
jgi:MoaA/NifB/PqqE/SkfB family radical SAM enzyme